MPRSLKTVKVTGAFFCVNYDSRDDHGFGYDSQIFPEEFWNKMHKHPTKTFRIFHKALKEAWPKVKPIKKTKRAKDKTCDD